MCSNQTADSCECNKVVVNKHLILNEEALADLRRRALESLECAHR